MSDKPLAGLVAAIAVAPLCLVCVLGPAAFVAAGGWFLGWLGGFGMPLIAAVLAAGGWLVWRILPRRTATRVGPKREPGGSRSARGGWREGVGGSVTLGGEAEK